MPNNDWENAKPPAKNSRHERIVDLHRSGRSYAEIAEIEDICERTVAKYMRDPPKAKVRKLDRFEGMIRNALKADPDMEGDQILDLIRKKGYDGCRSQFWLRLKKKSSNVTSTA